MSFVKMVGTWVGSACFLCSFGHGASPLLKDGFSGDWEEIENISGSYCPYQREAHDSDLMEFSPVSEDEKGASSPSQELSCKTWVLSVSYDLEEDDEEGYLSQDGKEFLNTWLKGVDLDLFANWFKGVDLDLFATETCVEPVDGISGFFSPFESGSCFQCFGPNGPRRYSSSRPIWEQAPCLGEGPYGPFHFSRSRRIYRSVG